MPTPILILAGNAAQAAMYCRDHGISLHDARYIMSPDQVRGYKEPRYAVCGTFWSSPRSIEIWKALVLCYAGSSHTPVAPPDIEPFLHNTLPTATQTQAQQTGNVVSNILKITQMLTHGVSMPPVVPDEPEEEVLPEPKRKTKIEFKRIRKS